MIAIGDIHGNLTHLKGLIDMLPKDKPLIFLGDYIDRGPDSEGVIEYLKELESKRECVFLKGNHEDMMLKAFQGSDSYLDCWLANGGEATILSYGGTDELSLDLEWFENLKTYHETDSTIFVHAGANANIPLKDQEDQFLLWAREEFYNNPDNHGKKKIMFGHTPTTYINENFTGVPWFGHDRELIGIDTGCFYSGILTAVDSETLVVYQFERQEKK